MRKVKDSFRERMTEPDPKKVEAFIAFGQENLNIIKRQVSLISLLPC